MYHKEWGLRAGDQLSGSVGHWPTVGLGPGLCCARQQSNLYTLY